MIADVVHRGSLLGSLSKLVGRLSRHHRMELLLFVVLCLEVVAFGANDPLLVSRSDIASLLQNIGPVAIIAPAECLVIMAAGMDLSVGSMVSVCSVIFGLLAQHGVPVGAVVLLTVMTGIGMGVVNGVLVAFLDVLPLIATLATLFIYATVAQVMIGAQSLSSIPNSVITLGSRVFFGFLPEQTLVIVVVAVVAAVLLERTVFGRQLGFIGANDRAANYAGIAVRRHRFETYLGTGVACAIASMVQVGFFASARSDSGTGLELVVITACLVGGIDAWGGSGSVLGVMLGCAIIATLEGWMDLKNIEPTEQQIAVGAMLVLTVGAQQLSGPIGIWLKERKSTWQNTVGPVGAGPLVSYGLPEAGETEAVMMAIEDPGR